MVDLPFGLWTWGDLALVGQSSRGPACTSPRLSGCLPEGRRHQRPPAVGPDEPARPRLDPRNPHRLAVPRPTGRHRTAPAPGPPTSWRSARQRMVPGLPRVSWPAGGSRGTALPRLARWRCATQGRDRVPDGRHPERVSWNGAPGRSGRPRRLTLYGGQTTDWRRWLTAAGGRWRAMSGRGRSRDARRRVAPRPWGPP